VDEHKTDLTSLRLVACGGSAVPLKLMQRFEQDHGMHIVQAWGMTETSPLAAIAHVPAGVPKDEEWTWRSRTGRIMVGVELRLVDDLGQILPWDGEAVGEIQVRGPWITGAYHLDDDPQKFDDGWLRTGDVAVAYPNGTLQITDRSKDVIKSGGEWISSVDLENAIMAHPDVLEASVVGVPDEKWGERPLASVVLKEGTGTTVETLHEFLEDKVAHWQVPERWALIDEVPKTSVGKFDKKVLRRRYAEGELEVTRVGAPTT
ncbi:MAG: AMP-binding protein, partial [Humibacillus sp.]